MYNKYIEAIFIKDMIFYAHTKEGGPKEPLYDHLKLTYSYYEKMEKYKNLNIIIRNIIKNLGKNITENVLNYAYDLFKSAVFYHDIGKINPVFQIKNMNNNITDKEINSNSEHAIFSARIYIDAYIKDIIDNKDIFSLEDTIFLIYLTYTFGYVISRHHTGLTNIDKFTSDLFSIDLDDIYTFKLEDITLKKILDSSNLEKICKNLEINGESIYILNKLLYSILVTADYYATYEYVSGKSVEFDIKKDYKLFDKYKSSELFNKINDYKNNKINIQGINKLRSDMFIESEDVIKNNIDRNIFYLEAPTGAGKTNISINLARIIYENLESINSINYIFPFNTLIEQTSNTFKKYFKEYDDYIVINSINSMVDEKKEILDYESAYIQNSFCHYNIQITSHVNLFDILFGVHKSSNYTLYNFINSIVIIDEIQAYSNEIWRNIINMLDKYASLLNIKFIIMSATLPRLDKMLGSHDSQYCNLIKNRDLYYDNELFKGRVKLDYSLLDSEINIELLKEKVLQYKNKKVLLEFIKKQTAREFYNLIKSDINNVYELTGDDNNYNRKKIIEIINKSDNVIVVATQTIEAGVDIDMDVGFKDISFLDSEEQFLGRINRSCKKSDCVAFFFNLDDAKTVYKRDFRLEYDLNNVESRKVLEDKNFITFYEKVLEKIYNSTEEYNKNNIVNLYIQCLRLDYENVSNKLKLIDNNTYQIFLNHTIYASDEIIIGNEVWNKYKEICVNNKYSFAYKSIELSKLKEKFNLFIYNMYDNSGNSCKHYDEKLGNVFYIENGEDYIEDGKFNRIKYQESVGGIFL